MDARHTLKCGIYKFNRLRIRCYGYTMFQLWCGFSISIGNSTGNTTEPWILVINKTATSDRPPLTVGLPVTSERYSASFQVTRLFHKATVSYCNHFLLLHMYLLFKTTPGWLQVWRGFFLPRFGEGALTSNVFTICTLNWSLSRRGYFGVSNIVLVSVGFYCNILLFFM